MMSKIVKLRYFVQMTACLLVCGMFAGCKTADAALVLPIAEEAGNESANSAEGDEVIGDASTMIYVYVCGAVVNPGVVELPEGSRADAALEAAGGFAADAQPDYVNLAAKVEDGQKLYFPTVAEISAQEYESYLEEAGLVNINTANMTQLMTLPGIGEARAQDIIEYRETHGDFEEKEDLKKVSGIKDSMYEKLAEKIVVQ